jgi:hypothetical protein
MRVFTSVFSFSSLSTNYTHIHLRKIKNHIGLRVNKTIKAEEKFVSEVDNSNTSKNKVSNNRTQLNLAVTLF